MIYTLWLLSIPWTLCALHAEDERSPRIRHLRRNGYGVINCTPNYKIDSAFMNVTVKKPPRKLKTILTKELQNGSLVVNVGPGAYIAAVNCTVFYRGRVDTNAETFIFHPCLHVLTLALDLLLNVRTYTLVIWMSILIAATVTLLMFLLILCHRSGIFNSTHSTPRKDKPQQQL